MIRHLTGYLNYSTFAELSVVMFAGIFIAIAIRTLLTRSETTIRQSRVVLDDWTTEENS